MKLILFRYSDVMSSMFPQTNNGRPFFPFHWKLYIILQKEKENTFPFIKWGNCQAANWWKYWINFVRNTDRANWRKYCINYVSPRPVLPLTKCPNQTASNNAQNNSTFEIFTTENTKTGGKADTNTRFEKFRTKTQKLEKLYF